MKNAASGAFGGLNTDHAEKALRIVHIKRAWEHQTRKFGVTDGAHSEIQVTQ